MSFRSLAAALGATALIAAPALAQTSFSQAFSFPQGASVPVSYLSFEVTSAGTFNFFTNSSATGGDGRPDPYLWLFTGRHDNLLSAIASDDDACNDNPAYCTGSSNSWDAFIRRDLGAGWYTMAVSRYTFTQDEARAGYADVSHPFDATLVVNSTDGVAASFVVAGPVATVPEPGTWALLGTGLVGVAAAARRRRRTAA